MNLFIAMIAVLVRADNFFDLNEDNYIEVFRDFYVDPDNTLPLFINMLVGECTTGVCPVYYKDSNIVAGITKKQNRIATIDCAHTGKVCSALPRFKEVNSMMSLYIKGKTIYGFEGEQSKDGLLDFLSDNNWVDAVVESDYDFFFETISGEK